MVTTKKGNNSSGKCRIKDEKCDGINYIKGEWYEFWDNGDEDWIGVEDELAKDLVETEGHFGYLEARCNVAEFKYYED